MKKYKKIVLLFMSMLMSLQFLFTVNPVIAAVGDHIIYDEAAKSLTVQGELSNEDYQAIKTYKAAEKVLIKNVKYDDCSNMFVGFTKLKEVCIDGLDTKNASHMFGTSDYAQRCKSLSKVEVKNWDSRNLTDISNMFYNCTALKGVDFGKMDFSSVTNMAYAFTNCKELETLDVKEWNVSNVTNMSNTFAFCVKLNTLELSNWNVHNVSDTSFMFNNCSALNKLEVQNWDVSKVEDISYMFSGCKSVEEIPAQNWNVSNVTKMADVFKDCTSLKSMPVENWDVSKVENMENIFSGSSYGSQQFTSYQIVKKYHDEVLDSEKKIKAVGETVTETAKDIVGYALESEASKTLTVSDVLENNVIVFKYLKRYNVIFRNAEDKEINKEVVTEGYSAHAPEAPLKARTPKYSYTFDKWDAEFNSVYSDMDIKPLYTETINKYNYIIKYRCGDEILDTIEKTDDYDKEVGYEPEELPGYRRISKDDEKIKITDDKEKNVLYVDYVKTFKVTFKDSKDEEIITQTVDIGKNATAPEVPKKDADAKYTYSFKEWDKPFEKVTSDIVVSPLYDKTINKYNYSIIYRCGEEKLKEIPGVDEYDKEISCKPETLKGYRLDSKPDVTLKITEKENENILYVDYVKTYEVVFKDADGNVIKKETVDAGTKAEAPEDPVKKADAKFTYTFKGWDSPFDKVKGDTVVSPVFDSTVNEYKYSIVYRSGNTELDRVDQAGGYDSIINFNAKEFEGYKLVSDTNKSIKVTEKEENNVLYVDYVKTYKVTFKDAEGNVIKIDIVTAGEKAEAPNNPEKKADAKFTYTFDKWDKSFDKVTEDMEVNPEYKETVNKYNYSPKAVKSGDTKEAPILIFMTAMSLIAALAILMKNSKVYRRN